MVAVNTAPLSLYLHIPFCDHRCAYCDFNAYAGLDALIPAYTDAMIREITVWGALLASPPVPTVFFGGGTPSLLPLPLLERIITALRAAFAIDAGAEWSLEVNPGTVDAAYFRGLRTLGINRISLGVQSFDDGELQRLDRIHDAAAATQAYAAARAAGFDNISLDLIFGLEGQTPAGWERNLRRAAALAPEHLSLYALTIEEGTPLARRIARGQAGAPDDDVQADMYEQAQALLAAAGYTQYEISNWALPGRACRHNLVYWRDGEWLGLGAGAHAHLAGHRFAVVASPAAYSRLAGRLAAPPAEWLPLLTGGGLPWIRSVETPARDRDLADAVAMELRLSEGLDLERFATRWGQRFEALFGSAASELIAQGLLRQCGDRLRIAPERRFVAADIIAQLLAAR